jgi:serine/threonine-protein kinase
VSDGRTALENGLQGSYLLERELGRGGMATVYLARDLKHKRPVALKVLHPHLAECLGPERFRREIETAARLQHPHILSVHDSGEVGDQLWFTMPYVRGESLRERLRRKPRLPFDEVFRIIREAGQALQHAHKEGIVHRDIKPENILLTEDGSTLVADFGIARALGSESTDTQHLTQTGQAIGTPAYMAPEQATGERTIDARVDQYALAVLTYELLAGTAPFTGSTPAAILAQRLSCPLPSVRAACPELSDAADQALRRALALDPGDRFGSVGEFVQALTATGSDIPEVRGTPVSRATIVVEPPRRRFRAAGVFAVLVLLATFALVVKRRGDEPRPASALAAPAASVTRVAVLPFENLGDSANAYFADGVADAVRGKLVRLKGLEVIARGSSVQYRKTTKPPQAIARELGVRYLLTGTVSWAKAGDGTSRVQVSPELVEVRDTAAPASRWQETFDAALEDVFQVQASIAIQVAQALDRTLDPAEERELAERPTYNRSAYDAYLRGEAAAEALSNVNPQNVRRAMVFYEQAVTRDNTFGIAWARLATARALLHGISVPTAELRAGASAALARAESLAPETPETYLARRFYEGQVRMDWSAALAASNAGLARFPNDPALARAAGNAALYLERTDEAVLRHRHAVSLDPRVPGSRRDLGIALLHLHRWSEGRASFEDALALAPDNARSLELAVLGYITEGDLNGARRLLAGAPATADRAETVFLVASDYPLYWALDDADQQLLLSLKPKDFDGDRGMWGLALAHTWFLRGDTARGRAYADSSRLAFEAQLRTAPDHVQGHTWLGIALAYLGRRTEAVAAGERALAIANRKGDVWTSWYLRHELARIHLLTNDPERALDLLEAVMKAAYVLSPAWLKIDPSFAALRGHPRFERLIAPAATRRTTAAPRTG